MKQHKFYNAAIYCRLSKDDEVNGESSSISTQKQMLTKYAKDNGWSIVDYYVDDGISGTTFERSGFKRMIDDIDEKRINLVLTKDLSRLGRDYLKTGFYTEVYFPENDVRYIAVNDGVDTLNKENDIAPFKNILNEMYAKDISKKIKSAYKIKAARGDHQGAFAPFGYKKHPDVVGRLLINEDTCETVKLIFELARQGLGVSKIRTQLIERKLFTPSAYLHSVNTKYFSKQYANCSPEYYYSWSTAAVARILHDTIYLGHTTHYKEISVSFKSKKRQTQSPDKWMIVENTHEPLITQEIWDIIKQRMSINSRPIKETREPHIFSKLVYCADCGWLMYLSSYYHDPIKKITRQKYFQCTSNRAYGKLKCTTHNTRYDLLYQLVLQEIRMYAIMALENNQELAQKLAHISNERKQKEFDLYSSELAESKARFDEIDLMFSKLYEDNVNGKISDRQFQAMSERYEKEQEQLSPRISKLTYYVEKSKQSFDSVSCWMKTIRKYADITELSREILNDIIERIDVYQPEKVDGKRSQRIDIIYRFVGCLN